MSFARSSMWRVLPAMLALFVLAGPVSLQAIEVAPKSTFTFSGVCLDCSTNGTATLVLQNYTQGNPIGHDNLFRFDYWGTNLHDPFNIVSGDTYTISGNIPASLAAAADFHIDGGAGKVFNSSIDGTWWVDAAPDHLFEGAIDDYGTNGVWNGAGVPEPAAFLLVAAGLAALGLRRWKERN